MLNEKQITGLTAEMIKNIEFMLGDENDRKYIELVELGNEFLDKKDYEKACELFEKAVEYNKRGYLELAQIYYYYIDDEEKAKSLFEKAFEEGVNDAAYYLGVFAEGDGDYEKAKKLYEIGEKIGNLDCIFSLGTFYENQMQEDYDKMALEKFEKAANFKFAFAMEKLLYNYHNKENSEKVKEWGVKILNERGLIQLYDPTIIRTREILEEYGEKVEKKVLFENYKIVYNYELEQIIEMHLSGKFS